MGLLLLSISSVDKKNVKDKAQRVMASYQRYKHLATVDIPHYALFEKAIAKIESLNIYHEEIFRRDI